MRRLSDVVPWRTVPLSPPRRLWLVLRTAFAGLWEACLLVDSPQMAGRPSPPDPDTRYDPGALIGYLPIEKVTSTPAEADTRLLLIRADRVELDHRVDTEGWRAPSTIERFDRARTTLLTARPLRLWWPRHRKAVDRRWEMTFAWRGQTWRLRGPWIWLAHVGCLSGWPEPTSE